MVYCSSLITWTLPVHPNRHVITGEDCTFLEIRSRYPPIPIYIKKATESTSSRHHKHKPHLGQVVGRCSLLMSNPWPPGGNQHHLQDQKTGNAQMTGCLGNESCTQFCEISPVYVCPVTGQQILPSTNTLVNDASLRPRNVQQDVTGQLDQTDRGQDPARVQCT